MPDPLTGTRKSAIVLLAIGPEQADQILRRMPNDAVKAVTREIAIAGALPGAARNAALGEFIGSAAGPGEQGGAGQPQLLDVKSSAKPHHADAAPAVEPPHDAPPAAAVVANPFAALHGAETNELLDSIRDEHPQTIALVLAHLPPNKAGDVLAGLPSQKQVEVVKRIATIEQISSEVIDQVERGLRQRLGHIMGRTIRSGGVSAVAEILNSADRRVEREILHTLDSDSPQLAEQIRRVQAIFEDLLYARDEDVRAVLEQLDAETIALSLRTARERLKRKVLRNLPGDEARQIEQELRSVEPVRICEIEGAQQRVVEVVHRLERTGEIRVTEQQAASRGRHAPSPVAAGSSSPSSSAPSSAELDDVLSSDPIREGI